MQAGVDRWLGADLAKEVGGKSVANGDFGTDDPNASRWSCGGPGKTRTCDLRFRKPLLYPAELRDRRNSAERHVTFSAAAPALPGRFFVHCHLPATFSSAVSAMTRSSLPLRGSSSDDLDLASARSLFLGGCGRSAAAGICFFAHQPQPEAHMDERRTLCILGWSLSGVVLLLFALAALSLPH